MTAAGGRAVGIVAVLHRFPVKSMGGETPDAVDLRWTGIRGDREYGFVREDALRRFPWFTGRELSALVTYRAAASGPYGPTGLPVAVRTPGGEVLPVGDPRLAAELAEAGGAPIRLVQLSRGTYDSMPVSVASTATFRAIDEAHGSAVDPGRFRINIVIESGERDRDWRGRVLLFGVDGPRLALVRPVERCAMITIDPGTGARDPSVMRTVAGAFGNEVGEYASALRPGIVRVGDPVTLLPGP